MVNKESSILQTKMLWSHADSVMQSVLYLYVLSDQITNIYNDADTKVMTKMTWRHKHTYLDHRAGVV